MEKGKTLANLKGTTVLHGHDVFPIVGGGSALIGIQRESKVDVLFYANPRRIRVKVWSNVKKNLFRFTDILVDGNSQREMQSKCGIAAGAIAEQLCALHNDTVEPSECAKAAGKHYAELCDHLSRPENSYLLEATDGGESEDIQYAE